MVKRLSICMITKNADEYLHYAMKAVEPFADEFIIVDDNSTDHTLDIISSFSKVRLTQGVYNGDKKKQRSEYLKHATGEWILVVDDDEVHYEKDLEWLMRLIDSKKDTLFVGIYLRNFWKDYCHVIDGHMWNCIRNRLFRNTPDMSYKIHYAPSLPDGKTLHEIASDTGRRMLRWDYQIAHYGYCKRATDLRNKIRYYMKRDNPDANTPESVEHYTNIHPYFSGNFDQPRYGAGGLYCCGSAHGKKDIVKRFTGRHPEVMKSHPKFKMFFDYVKNMNDYMENHWQFNNHLDHTRHQNRLRLTAKMCLFNTLEVGCANGYSTNFMQSCVSKDRAKFSGVEPTDWGYSQAVMKYPNIKFYKAMGENLPFEDGAFDTVLLAEIIEHCIEPHTLVEEAWRVTKKRLIVTTPTQPHPDPDHKRHYSTQDMTEFLRRYGEPKFVGLNKQGEYVPSDFYFQIAWVDKFS